MRASKAETTNEGLVGSMREGVLAQRHLLIGEEGSPNNYDLNTGRAGAGGWRTPRHRHNFDQIRYVLKGDFPYADGKVLPEGWVGYFPESVFYGPQDRPEGLETMVLQLGGASGGGYLSVAGREAANEALKAKGEFRKGRFHWTDESGVAHDQDASEACFEYATGRKLEFAKARYESVVVMDPSAFAWIPEGGPGVDIKWVGAFTERDARIGFIRIAPGRVYSAGLLDATAILFLIKGRVTVEGVDYPAGSAFEFAAGEGPLAVAAQEAAEFICMTLHKF